MKALVLGGPGFVGAATCKEPISATLNDTASGNTSSVGSSTGAMLVRPPRSPVVDVPRAGASAYEPTETTKHGPPPLA